MLHNPVVRAVRTFLQVFVGLVLAGWADVANMSDVLSLAESAAVASVPAVLAFLQNVLEDNTSLDVPKG